MHWRLRWPISFSRSSATWLRVHNLRGTRFEIQAESSMTISLPETLPRHYPRDVSTHTTRTASIFSAGIRSVLWVETAEKTSCCIASLASSQRPHRPKACFTEAGSLKPGSAAVGRAGGCRCDQDDSAKRLPEAETEAQPEEQAGCPWGYRDDYFLALKAMSGAHPMPQVRMLVSAARFSRWPVMSSKGGRIFDCNNRALA
jgi:hypothetical protein